MNTVFFSVIIPSLNEELLLPKLLDDLKKQKETSFEVIIVDGDSNDNTKQKALFLEKELSLRFFTVNKRNVSYQRNYGAERALGKYLIFFDADLRIDSTFLKKLRIELEKNKALIFLPHYFSQENFFQDKTIFAAFNLLIEASHITMKPVSLGCAMIFEKNYFHHLGGFNEKLFMAEDEEIVSRAKRYGVSAKILKKIGVKLSMRRWKKEGMSKLLTKYLIKTYHTLHHEGVEKKLFEYEMGGHHYKNSMNKQKKFEEEIRGYLSEIKKVIRKLTD